MNFSEKKLQISLLPVLFFCAQLNIFAGTSMEDNLKSATTFEVDYASSMDKFNACFSKGNANGTIIASSTPEFDFEPMSTVNNGLKTGENCASIQYEAAGNLSPVKGSVEIVVKNLNWEWDDNRIHLFMQTSKIPANGTLMYIYKHADDGLGVYLEQQASKEKLFLRTKPDKWALNSKHHLILTYDESEITLYVDGTKRAGGKLTKPENWSKYFTAGPGGKFGRNGQSVIGRINLYNRALLQEEVSALAQKRLPGLKIETSGNKNFTEEMLPPSPWFDNRVQLGLEALSDDFVMPPLTPVALKKDQIEVWGRTYDLSGTELLNGISSNHQELLRAPISAIAEINEKSVTMKFGSFKVMRQGNGRIVMERPVTFNGGKGRAEFTFEYDGMIWCSLEIEGTQNITKFELVVPLTGVSAQMVHYVGVTKNLASVVGPQYSYSQSLSSNKGSILKLGFVSHLWVGNTDGGLQFFAESDRNWWPVDRKDAIELIRTNDSNVNMAIKFLASAPPITGRQNLSYNFGFIATPVKPMPRGWRGKTISAQYESFTGKKRGTLLIYWPDKWEQMTVDPEPSRARDVDKLQAQVKNDHAENRKVVPYWSRLHLSISEKGKTNPDALKVKDEWSPEPQRQRGEHKDWMRAAATTAWSDYMIWTVEQWNKKFGPADGVYIDEMELTPNFREKTGGGYTDFNGKRRPTYSVMADRNLYKRIHYVLMKNNSVSANWSVAHCSGTMMMEVLSPFTCFLTGEHLYSGYFPNNQEFLPPPEDKLYYYSYALPIDRVKSEFFWKQWGSVIAFLPCLKNQRDIMNRPESARDLLSRIMQGDMIVWPLWCNSDEVYKTWQFREDFKIDDPAVEFIPYWKNTALLVNDENIKIGYYKNGSQILAIVSNLNRKPATANIKIDGIEIKSVKNAETKTSLELKDKSLNLNIPRNDYVALRINY